MAEILDPGLLLSEVFAWLELPEDASVSTTSKLTLAKFEDESLAITL